LQKAGYFVGHVGKWQYNNQKGYQERLFNHSKMYHGGYWWMMNGVNTHVTDRTRAEAVQFLKEARPKDVPFALTVAFGPPKGGMQRHDTTPEFVDMYKHAFFPEPYNVTHAYSLLPWFLQNEKSEARLRYDYRWKGFGKVQEGMKTYFALMSQIDDACRQIIDVIKDQGLMDETMIIFTADNGEFHSSHGLSDKWYPYQESIRVPLIIYDPRIPPEKRGTLDESLVLNVDLAETILGAAGLPPDALMQGRDMADLYLPPNRPPFDRKKPRQEPWRNEFYYEFPSLSPDIEPSTALVRKEWKYIKWTERGYEQLFHLEHDPLEMYDLRNVSEFQSLVEIMRARHDQLQLEAMAPIIPGTQCDTLIPPKTQIQEWPECCCVGNHTENLSEFYFGK
jgi:arylsulfatase